MKTRRFSVKPTRDWCQRGLNWSSRQSLPSQDIRHSISSLSRVSSTGTLRRWIHSPPPQAKSHLSSASQTFTRELESPFATLLGSCSLGKSKSDVSKPFFPPMTFLTRTGISSRRMRTTSSNGVGAESESRFARTSGQSLSCPGRCTWLHLSILSHPKEQILFLI